jgi:L-rhamnonate dehydratase
MKGRPLKITRVEAMVLRLPEVNTQADGTQDTCLIRIETDSGHTGWGEVDSCPSAIKAIVDAPLSHKICTGVATAIVGEDPLAIAARDEQLRQAMNYYGRTGLGVHARAGVNMALWDLYGRVTGQPVYRLLGGPFQTRFRAYSSVLFEATPAQTQAAAERWVGQGFTAVKFGWGPLGTNEATDLAQIAAARKGLGPSADLLIDAGQCYDVRTAIRRAHQFAEYRPFWLEEMLAPDDLTGYRQLSQHSPTPIAAGESDSLLTDFEALLDQGGLDWVQPDPARCGISGMHSIGLAAIRRKKRICNHTFKSGITLAASLHVLAALPGATLCEFCMADSPLRHELTHETFRVDDGYVTLSDAPGLGVTVNLDTVQRYRVA